MLVSLSSVICVAFRIQGISISNCRCFVGKIIMVHFYSRLCLFLIGMLLGIFLGKQCIRIQNVKQLYSPFKTESSYEIWFSKQQFKRRVVLWDILRYKERKHILESDLLFNKIKILCIIFIQNVKNINGIKDTWTKGCQDLKLIEIVSQKKSISVKRTPENSSWILLCKTLQSLSLDYDWFLVVKDNTFVVLENLRYYVASLNSTDVHYFGHLFKFWNIFYNSGQAGYVLSKGALTILKSTLNHRGCTMNAYWNREDFYLGKQLAELNITPSDTNDKDGFSTFHPYTIYQLFFPQDSYYQLSVFSQKCCSRHSITFQAADGDKMYQYYYLIYKLQIFLYGHLGNKIPPSIDHDLVWKEFLKEHGYSNYNISNERYYQIWENLIQDPSSFAAQMKKEMHIEYEDQN